MDEWAASLSAGAGRGVRSVGRAVADRSTIEALKAAALAEIDAQGLTDSECMDLIIPVLIQGIGRGLQSSVFVDQTIKADILTLTADSFVKSAGKEERKDKVTAGVTIAVVASRTAETVVSQAVVVITEPELKKNTVSTAVGAAITALKQAESLDSETKKAAISATVNLVTKIVLDNANASSGPAAAEELVQAVGQGAVSSSIEVIGTSEAAEVIGSIVEATAQAIAEIAGTDSVATLATAVVASVSVAAETAGVEIEVSVIVAAVNAGVREVEPEADPVLDEETVTEVITEEAPTAAASADPANVTAKNTEVTLSAEGSAPGADKAGLTYKWAQIGGPVATLTGIDTDTATFTPLVPGTYVFKLTVKNIDGNKFASKNVTVMAMFTADKYDEGIQSIKRGDYVGARAAFSVAANAGNNEAKFWLAFLDIMSLSVSDDIVSLMRNNLGFVTYPSNLNTLLTDTWFNSNWYNTKAGIVQSEHGYMIRGYFTPYEDDANAPDDAGYYSIPSFGSEGWIEDNSMFGVFEPNESGTEYAYYWDWEYYTGEDATDLPKYRIESVIDLMHPIMLPKLEVPAWAESMFVESGGYVFYNYGWALFLNVITRNPQGLNGVIDKILSGAYGTAFENLYDRIMEIPDDAEINLPIDMINAASGQVVPIEPFTIGAPELKLYAAQMRVQKSFVELLASYNLSYPLTNLQIDFRDWFYTGTPGESQGMPQSARNFFATAPNPIEAGFLSNRSNVTRAAAKASLIEALEDIATIAEQYTPDYCAKFDIFGDPDASSTPSGMIAFTAGKAKEECEKGIAALTSGGSYSYTFDEEDSESSAGIEVNPNPVYNTAFFSFSNIFETTATGFKVYGAKDLCTDEDGEPDYNYYEHSPDVTTIAEFDRNEHVWPLLCINVGNLESVYPGVTMILSGPFRDGNKYYLPLSWPIGLEDDDGNYVLDDDGSLLPDPENDAHVVIDWLRGQ